MTTSRWLPWRPLPWATRPACPRACRTPARPSRRPPMASLARRARMEAVASRPWPLSRGRRRCSQSSTNSWSMQRDPREPAATLRGQRSTVSRMAKPTSRSLSVGPKMAKLACGSTTSAAPSPPCGCAGPSTSGSCAAKPPSGSGRRCAAVSTRPCCRNHRRRRWLQPWRRRPCSRRRPARKRRADFDGGVATLAAAPRAAGGVGRPR
mmetsp:Transcript_102395/g.285319  ORF Transcript_102395/g.285319 Transcript_102395/m.285319 type:complete len:208 (-) Transcript_102395:38-661(-)